MAFGRSLLLLPGLLNDHALWRYQKEHLANEYEVKIADLTRQDSIAAMAADTLAEAPPRFALCGLSMGGYVAFEMMRQAPERISALILMDTSAQPDTPEQTRRRLDFIRMAQTGRFKGVTPRLLPSLVARKTLDNTEVTGTILAMAERLGRDVYIRQQKAIIERMDSRPYLAKIFCPTMIVVGEEDSVTPLAIASEMASLIHASTLEIIKDSGHLPPLEQPEVSTELIKVFLKHKNIV